MSHSVFVEIAGEDPIAFDPATLAARLVGERAADIVEALNERTPHEAAEILRALPREYAVEALDQPSL
jgi:magnesium transporter